MIFFHLHCMVNGVIADWVQSAYTLDVQDGDFFGTGKLTALNQGDIRLPYSWASRQSR